MSDKKIYESQILQAVRRQAVLLERVDMLFRCLLERVDMVFRCLICTRVDAVRPYCSNGWIWCLGVYASLGDSFWCFTDCGLGFGDYGCFRVVVGLLWGLGCRIQGLGSRVEC